MADLKQLICQILDEKQAEQIVTIDLRQVNPFTDYFVICTAKNVRHSVSLMEHVEEAVLKHGYTIRAKEGSKDSPWLVLDTGEVLVHIFTQDARQMYRLEALWADLPQTTYQAA